MTTPIVPTVTDELIADLEAAANAATPGPWNYDGSYVCTMRQEDGTVYVESWNPIADALLTKNVHYIAQANPATILALLAERADLKQRLAAASVDAERWRYARSDTSAGKSDICVVKKIWGDGCKHTQEIILTEAEADAAVDAAVDIAAMDIGSGD